MKETLFSNETVFKMDLEADLKADQQGRARLEPCPLKSQVPRKAVLGLMVLLPLVPAPAHQGPASAHPGPAPALSPDLPQPF